MINLQIDINIGACKRLLRELCRIYDEESSVFSDLASSKQAIAPAWKGPDADRFESLMIQYADELRRLKREGEATCRKMELCLNKAEEIESLWN